MASLATFILTSLQWIGGALFLLVGVTGSFTGDLIAGLASIGIGFVLLPPVASFLRSKAAWLGAAWTRTGIVLALLLVVGLNVPKVATTPTTKAPEPTEQATEPERTYPWLNTCSEGCERALEAKRITFINDIDDCETLNAMYSTKRNANHVVWRLAINDRAAYLGCEGFPKTMEDIQNFPV